MKRFCIILGVITGLLLLSTLICGLWIKSNHVTDVSSLKFHMGIGIWSVIFGLISVIALMVQVSKH